MRLIDIDPTIQQSPRYATRQNFVGQRIRGYHSAQIMVTPEAADALAEAQTAAQSVGLSLLVYDGYRPQQAVDHFVAWGRDLADISEKATYYPDVPKSELFKQGYIAARSGHSRGSTVDLTLTRDGRPLDMGSIFDFFGERSHTENPKITGESKRNRLLLRRIMSQAGFRNYHKEWWHYTLVDEPYPDTYFNVPID